MFFNPNKTAIKALKKEIKELYTKSALYRKNIERLEGTIAYYSGKEYRTNNASMVEILYIEKDSLWEAMAETNRLIGVKSSRLVELQK